MKTEDTGEYDYWSRLAGTFDDDNPYIIGEATNSAVRAWLEGQFGDEDAVLELGCGTGFTSTMIAGIVKHLTATDMSEEMLERARAGLGDLENVRIQVEDCYGTSFGDGTFDAVLLANLIHLVRRPGDVMREAWRVLKPGGRVVVVDYTSYGLTPEDKKAMMRRYFSRWGEVPPWSFAASPERLRGLAAATGFEVEEAILIGEGSKAVCMRARKIL
jgi:ubiquinone/menaquinone biosynthesis C-methylase UbiE